VRSPRRVATHAWAYSCTESERRSAGA
jgi:hypothetical protein